MLLYLTYTKKAVSGRLYMNKKEICRRHGIWETLGRAEELYYLGAVRMFRFIKAGMDLKK